MNNSWAVLVVHRKPKNQNKITCRGKADFIPSFEEPTAAEQQTTVLLIDGRLVLQQVSVGLIGKLVTQIEGAS